MERGGNYVVNTNQQGSPGVYLKTSGRIATEALTHVVFTRDAAGEQRLYVDGQEAGGAQ